MHSKENENKVDINEKSTNDLKLNLTKTKWIGNDKGKKAQTRKILN